VSARESQAPGGSAKARARVSKCPICGKPQIEHYRPFCSKHCADIDLGRWLEGRYAVPGEPASPDAAEEDQD
jgi:endogenous inhibitor of DNA gyrase (YacG/DUF329 family)